QFYLLGMPFSKFAERHDKGIRNLSNNLPDDMKKNFKKMAETRLELFSRLQTIFPPNSELRTTYLSETSFYVALMDPDAIRFAAETGSLTNEQATELISKASAWKKRTA
ncbi:MAG: hypothetical protein Q7K42_01685, partial [Candidatus Diapherotrites archaeon]|nr:hypothetical protein [Candidatus Diapherotrites archaeon]